MKKPTGKKFTGKQAILIFAPIAIAAAIIYFTTRKKPSVPGTEDEVKDVPPPLEKSTPSVASGFPLKQGSTGEKVKTLQRIIGTNPDGIFGPNTLASLQAFAGISSVLNQSELDKLQKKATGISTGARANELIRQFNANPALSMYTIKDVTAEFVNIDYAGALQFTDKYKTFPGARTWSRADYILKSATKMGQLVFEINKGALAGFYIVDPTNISLK